MRRILWALLPALLWCTAALANGPTLYTQGAIQIIGRGCTTMFYIDPMCKPCGTGMKSNGTVMVVADWSSSTAYPLGQWITYRGKTTAIGALSWTNGVVTATLATAITGLSVNATFPISVSGAQPSGYNGSFTATLTSSTTFTYPLAANPGTATTPGNYQPYPNGSYWAALAANTNSDPMTGTAGNWQEAPTPFAGYLLVQNPAGASVPAYYSMGDMPDADPNDPTVCTTAQWATKWGCGNSTCTSAASDNTAMVNYLNNDFGFTNTGSIYYVSMNPNPISLTCTSAPGSTGCTLSPVWSGVTTPTTVILSTGQVIPIATLTQNGNVSWTSTTITGTPTTSISVDGVVNDPSHPYMTVAAPLSALTTAVQDFSGKATTTSRSPFVTIDCSSGCTGTLTRTSKFMTGTGLTGGLYVEFQEIPAYGVSWGGSGTYLMTGNAASSNTGEAVTAGHFPGGVIVIRGGNWPGCTSNIPSSPCLSFVPGLNGNGGNPNVELSGSPGKPLLLTSFPGEAAVMTSMSGASQFIDLMGVGAPYHSGCCVVINGMEFQSPQFGQGDTIDASYFQDLTMEHIEYSGNDKIQNGSTFGVVMQDSVCHDELAHCRYDDWNSGCEKAYSNPGTDTDFGADTIGVENGSNCGAIYGSRLIDNVIYDSGYEGYDVIHLNGWSDGTVVMGNIMAYSGYTGLQTGDYGTEIVGNLFADNTAEGILLYLYANNYSYGSVNGTNQITVTNIPYGGSYGAQAWQVQTGYYINGPCIPPGTTTITAVPASGGNTTGTYTLSAAATCSQSEPFTAGSVSGDPGPSTHRWITLANNIIWMGNISQLLPPIYGKNPGLGIEIFDKTGISYIKNVAITGNTIITYDVNTASEPSLPLEYYAASANNGYQFSTSGSFPETDTITGNTFYSINAASTGRVMWVQSGASATIAAGVYTFTGTGQFDSMFPGNSYAPSNPFPGTCGATCDDYLQQPWLMAFGEPAPGKLGNLR